MLPYCVVLSLAATHVPTTITSFSDERLQWDNGVPKHAIEPAAAFAADASHDAIGC